MPQNQGQGQQGEHPQGGPPGQQPGQGQENAPGQQKPRAEPQEGEDEDQAVHGEPTPNPTNPRSE